MLRNEGSSSQRLGALNWPSLEPALFPGATARDGGPLPARIMRRGPRSVRLASRRSSAPLHVSRSRITHVVSSSTFTRTSPRNTTASVVSGNSSSSGSSLPPGLTGWAAFTKTSNPGSSSTKLSPGQPASSKPPPPTSGSKPVGLSALASKPPGDSSTASTAVMKPPPPLTLGKQVLSRSARGESSGKGTGSQPPGGASSSSLGGNGGAGGNGGNSSNSNGAKASADGKTPTSQESQLHAMKRLQMVKKKAAQKKLKK